MVSSRPMPHARESAFAKTYRVASYDVGPDHRATVAAVLRYLHDGAQAHAAGEGFGYVGLLAARRAWALVSLDLHFGERPRGETDLVTYTSVARAKGPLVWRDYAATADGGLVAEGQSLWALIDLDTRSTTAPPPDLREALARVERPIQQCVSGLRRLGRREAKQRHVSRVALTHDCDFNGHLNNVVAAAWLLDAAYGAWAASATPATLVADARAGEERLAGVPKLRRVFLTYHHEVLNGETVTVAYEVDGGGVYVELLGDGGARLAVNGWCVFG